jgi:hypothetical protein
MVDKNRVLQIGNPGNAKIFGRVGRMYSLFRQLNMNEFDVVVWAMGASFVLNTQEVIKIDLRASVGKDPFAKFQKLYQSFVGELLGWLGAAFL